MDKNKNKPVDCPYCEVGNTNCGSEDSCAKYNAWLDTKDAFKRNSVIKELIGDYSDKNPLQVMMEMQLALQTRLQKRTGKNPQPTNPEEINERMLLMERAIQDELAEIRQHLNWKDWRQPDWTKFDDMTELRKEVIDIWHFVMNMFIITGMNWEDVFNIYMSKNVENVLRQKYDY